MYTMFSFLNKPLSQIYFWVAFITVIPALQTIAAPAAYVAFPNLITDVSFSLIVLGMFIFHSLVPLAGIFLLLRKKPLGLIFCIIGWLAFIVRNIAIAFTAAEHASEVTVDIWTFTIAGAVVGLAMIGYIVWILKQEAITPTPVEARIHQ